MKKINAKRVFSIVSAICFLIFQIWTIINNISGIKINMQFGWYGISYYVTVIIGSVAMCILAALILLGKKNIILLAVSGLTIIINIVIECKSPIFVSDIIYYLPSIILFVDILLNVTPSLKKYLNLSKVFCFISPVILIISFIIIMVQLSDSFVYSRVPTSTIVNLMLQYLLLIAGYLFASLWLSNFEFCKTTSTVQTHQNQPTKYQPVQQKKSTDADKLVTYKKLLDSGAISKEEFEQKKNEVLNS